MTENMPDLPAIAEDEDGLADVELEAVDFTILIQVRNVKSMVEARDRAAIALARYGMDTFHILATDPASGKQWFINEGGIRDADEVVQDLQPLLSGD